MKLALSVVKSTGSYAEIEEVGTFASQLSKGDKLQFSNKNLEALPRPDGTIARVTVFIHEPNGEAPKMMSCTTRLSAVVRKALKTTSKKDILRAIVDLNIIKNEVGYFIAPKGSVAEGFTLTELLKEEPINYEELVAL